MCVSEASRSRVTRRITFLSLVSVGFAVNAASTRTSRQEDSDNRVGDVLTKSQSKSKLCGIGSVDERYRTPRRTYYGRSALELDTISIPSHSTLDAGLMFCEKSLRVDGWNRRIMAVNLRISEELRGWSISRIQSTSSDAATTCAEASEAVGNMSHPAIHTQ